MRSGSSENKLWTASLAHGVVAASVVKIRVCVLQANVASGVDDLFWSQDVLRFVLEQVLVAFITIKHLGSPKNNLLLAASHTVSPFTAAVFVFTDVFDASGSFALIALIIEKICNRHYVLWLRFQGTAAKFTVESTNLQVDYRFPEYYLGDRLEAILVFGQEDYKRSFLRD